MRDGALNVFGVQPVNGQFLVSLETEGVCWSIDGVALLPHNPAGTHLKYAILADPDVLAIRSRSTSILALSALSVSTSYNLTFRHLH